MSVIVSETDYTAGQDHEGRWWVIAPLGETGYPLTRGIGGFVAQSLANACNTSSRLPEHYNLESADPPPELVGGPGLDDEFVVASYKPADLTAPDFPEPRTYTPADFVAVAVEDVVAAWLDKGTHPAHHDIVKLRLRDAWPVMFRALERLAEDYKKMNAAERLANGGER